MFAVYRCTRFVAWCCQTCCLLCTGVWDVSTVYRCMRLVADVVQVHKACGSDLLSTIYRCMRCVHCIHVYETCGWCCTGVQGLWVRPAVNCVQVYETCPLCTGVRDLWLMLYRCARLVAQTCCQLCTGVWDVSTVYRCTRLVAWHQACYPPCMLLCRNAMWHQKVHS